MEHASLMYGTLLSQLAVGTFVAGYALTRSEEHPRFRLVTLVALIAGVVGVGVFFTHLGAPANAFNAIRNVGTSWLAREALLYPAFLLLLVLCLLTKDGKLLRGLTALCGLALVLTTAMIYILPGVPAWNSAATPLSFILAAFLMGIPLAALLLKQGGRTCALVLGAAALLALVVTLTQTMVPQGAEPAAAASASLLAAAPAFRIRIGLLVIAAIAAIVFALRGAKDATGGKPAAVPVFLLLFCLLAVSEILGRALFFGTIVRM